MLSAMFFFLKIVWFFAVFYGSIPILGFFYISVKNVIRILMEIALNLQMILGSVIILAILIITIHKHGISFHLCLLQFLSSLSYSFQHTDLSPFLFNLFLSILLFLMLCNWDSFHFLFQTVCCHCIERQLIFVWLFSFGIMF